MTKSDSAALGVDLVHGNAKLLNAVSGLGCEGLVNFVNVNVANTETGFVDGGRNRNSGSNTLLCINNPMKRINAASNMNHA
jgi:hypothetical protein